MTFCPYCGYEACEHDRLGEIDPNRADPVAFAVVQAQATRQGEDTQATKGTGS